MTIGIISAAMAARPLTDGEIALALPAFGAAFDYARVRIAAGWAGNAIAAAAFANGHPAITLGRRVHFHRRALAAFGASEAGKALLIHELIHVWQYRKLGLVRFLLRYVREFAQAGFHAPSLYSYVPGETRFGEATLEAQAQMAGDYSIARWRGDEEALRRLARNLAGSGLYGL